MEPPVHYRVRIYVTPEFHPMKDVGVDVTTESPAKSPRTRTDAAGIANVPMRNFDRTVPSRVGRTSTLRPDPLILTLFNQKGSVALVRTIDPSRLRGREITVPLSYHEAVLAGLLMHKGRRSTTEKRDALCESWAKRRDRERHDDVLGQCLAREILELGSRLDQPGTPLEERLRKAADKSLDQTTLAQVGELFAKANDTFEHCWPDDCPPGGGTLDGWIDRLFLDVGAPGSSLVKALKTSVVDPRALLGDPRAGHGIGLPVDIGKTCLDKLETGELPQETAETLAGVVAGELTELAPPSVNLVEVWARDPWADADTARGSVVRVGEVPEERLTFSERLLLENGAVTVDTGVELDSPDCLILEADEQGLQRFFVDVKPRQVVTLKGSGFVSGKARASVRFRRYAEGVESELMSFLNDWETQPGFELVELDVHGSQLSPAIGSDPETTSGDRIVFEWPEAAATPGLYQIELEFDNESEHHLEIDVDPDSCEATIVKDGTVSAAPLHFVVPPDLEEHAVRLRATVVDCLDETDPEALIINLADDTNYQVSGMRGGTRLENPDATDPMDMFSFEEIGESVMREASRRFWSAPDSWLANLQTFPESALQILPFEEMVSMNMALFEIDSELDQALIRAALVLLLITIVLLTFFVMAALIVTLIATGVITVASFGSGAALTIIVAAVTAAMTGVFFSAIMAVIAAIVAAVPGAEVIAAGATSYSGLELAHRLSPLRLHRVVWAAERPAVEDASVNARRISSSLEDGDYTEVFRADNLGGRYDLTAAVHTE